MTKSGCSLSAVLLAAMVEARYFLTKNRTLSMYVAGLCTVLVLTLESDSITLWTPDVQICAW